MELTNLVSDPTKLQTHGKYISVETAYWDLKNGAPTTHERIQAVASDPLYAYGYAYEIINGRFPEGEAAIAFNARYAHWYARDVIRGRFTEGESTIALDPHHAYWYARDIIKGRFPEGEAAINSDAYFCQAYAKWIGTQWP